MSAQNDGKGGAGQGEAAASLGIGNPTSGEEGATLTHETMAETGGSGGEALTKPHREEVASGGARQEARPGSGQDAPGGSADDAEGAGTAATAITRGAQDTRSRQASPGSTGLGAPETGGNQREGDLAPPRGD